MSSKPSIEQIKAALRKTSYPELAESSLVHRIHDNWEVGGAVPYENELERSGIEAVAKALSSATSSGSEADTKPSGTLEENIRQILLETVQFTHTSGNNIEIQPDLATQALLSLYQKELVRELSEMNSAYYALAGANRNRAFAELLSERITKLTGEQP